MISPQRQTAWTFDVIVFDDSSSPNTSFVNIPFTGVLTPVFFPWEIMAPFSCLISVILPRSMSWSIEDLLALVDNKIFHHSFLGSPTSLMPIAWLTAIH